MKTKLLLIVSSFFFLTGFFGSSYDTENIRTASSYETEAWIYKSKADETKDIGIVFLHGKKGNPSVDHNSKFINQAREAGYNVVAPVMPWAKKRGYEGTRNQGQEVIDEAIKLTQKDKVVVVGHSMGAMAVIQYGARGVPKQVIGLVAIAAGHDPHNAPGMVKMSEADASKACSEMNAGRGKEKRSYPEVNNKKRYTINASAEYYCTFYSMNEYPSSLDNAKNINTPLFVLSGEQDRLTKVYDHDVIYSFLPANPKNVHQVLPGKHKNVLFKHVDAVTQWIEKL